MGLKIFNSDVQWSVIRVDVSSTKRHILNCTRKIDFESMKFAQTGETISIAEHDFGCKWRLEEFQSLQINFKALTVLVMGANFSKFTQIGITYENISTNTG